MMMMMIMMCNGLMYTYKLTRSQLSLAHSAKVKTYMPEKNEKQLESVESAWWVERLKNYGGKDLWKS